MSTHPLQRSYGPAAIEDDARRFFALTYTLARTEFKVRYFGSALGYLWSLMRPLMFFGVLYVVFTQVFSLGKRVPHYPVYLLTSIVLWTFFAETTSGCVTALVAREGMLRKMRFPRLVVPLSVALTSTFNLTMNFIAVMIFTLANGVTPRLGWLEMIPLVGLVVTFAVGIGMLLSALYVRFRDIQPIWDVVQQALFYASPIVYTTAQYKGLARIAMINPIAAILTQMHAAFIGSSPDYVVHSAARTIGGGVRLLLPLGIILAVFAVGFAVFSREAPRISENL